MFLIVGAICGIITAAIASSKGRSVVGWFFVGFLLGLIGVIISLCMSNLKQQKAKEAFAAQERHRLREQLRQERLKNEAFRQYSTARLDAHDKHLGIETHTAESLPHSPVRQALPSQGNEALDALLSQTRSPTPVPAAQTNWFYDRNGQPVGPMPESEIHRMIQSGGIQKHTLVWTEGYDDWVAAKDVQQFQTRWDS
jgi:uncharacterized membrane protein YeaQ/YmgE (transglycosylase-associated protein family)